jgi:hypothetical protein
MNRRTATKVVNGKVQRKNRSQLTSCSQTVIDRQSAGPGYCHVLSKRDLYAFIDLIPDWNKLSQRLERIILASPDPGDDASLQFYYRNNTSSIELYAWDEDLWICTNHSYFESHRSIFDRIGLSYDIGKEDVICRFSEAQARAFMLLHVFMHELGHHYDHMTQKHRRASRGEDYAERFANNHFASLYPAFVETFGDPSRGS